MGIESAHGDREESRSVFEKNIDRIYMYRDVGNND